jgi:hypothetical protein
MIAAPYVRQFHTQYAGQSTHGDTAEDLTERQKRTTKRCESADKHHPKRDGGVEQTSRYSEEDPGIDSERESERERDEKSGP